MLPSKNKDIVENLISIYTSQNPDFEDLDRYVTKDTTIWQAGLEVSYQEWKNLVLDQPPQVTDCTIEMLVEGNTGGAAKIKYTDKNSQMENIFDISEKEIETSILCLWQTRGEKITQMSILEPTIDILTQLDIIDQDLSSIVAQNQYLMVINRILRHNLRTQINLVDIYASSLIEGEGDVGKIVEKIQNETSELLDTAQKARTLQEAIIDRELSQEPVNIAAVAQETVDKFNKKIEVSFQYDVKDDTVATICTDQTLVRLVLRELVENALNHTDDPTPTVMVRVSEPEKTDMPIELVVADSGPGIPTEELDPIQQREETQLQHTSGIGLWIVRLGVTRLNGDLHFETDAHKGTTVHIRLPDMNTPTG